MLDAEESHRYRAESKPGEVYSMIITTGVASTTHIDRHYEKMAKSALDGMARQINEAFIPQLIEHDPTQQIGVVLYGEVFPLSDGEYALGVVSGVFESSAERERFITGQPNNVWNEYRRYLNVADLVKMVDQNQQLHNADVLPKKLNLSDLLELHLDSTQVSIDGSVYKVKRFIASSGDLKIEVFPKDHTPEHFHVTSKQRGIDARFDMNTLDIISMKRGSIAEKDIRKIKVFFETHPDELVKLREEYDRLCG